MLIHYERNVGLDQSLACCPMSIDDDDDKPRDDATTPAVCRGESEAVYRCTSLCHAQSYHPAEQRS